jgi:AcrR family transcriptional regulator
MRSFAGQGDARRSMALLWRAAEPPGARTKSPGPKPGLSVDVIVDAAVAVADTDGIAGLSMRKVGKQLERSGMALYTYVPTKSELLDLMYDRVHAELPARPGHQQHWREAVTSWADDLWAIYLRHPWVLQVSYARPVLGPNEQAVLEELLRILDQTGLPAMVLRRIVSVLFHLVRGTAQTVAESRVAATATGMSDQEWWSTRSALLQEVAPDFTQRFPLSARIGSQAPAQPKDNSEPYLEGEAKKTFTMGLSIVLDWIEATTAGESEGSERR